MANVSKSKLRGLIVPDRRLSEVWEAESTYTQADPQVGAVEPGSTDSRLALQASGRSTPAAPSTSRRSGLAMPIRVAAAVAMLGRIRPTQTPSTEAEIR